MVVLVEVEEKLRQQAHIKQVVLLAMEELVLAMFLER
jgi:hypothetical protein